MRSIRQPCFVVAIAAASVVKSEPSFEVSLAADLDEIISEGRVLVYLTDDNDPSPPLARCDDSQSTAQIFGIDVSEFSHDSDPAIIDNETLGYPRRSLGELESKEYLIQAQLLRYDKYRRQNETVILPVSCVSKAGNDGSYGSPVGSILSKPIKTTIAPGRPVKIELTEAVKPVRGPGCVGNGKANSTFIKTVSMRSALLSNFWGRHITLEACVLLPWGFDEYPKTRYPLIFAQTHYSAQWNTGGGFATEPPPADMPAGLKRDEAEAAYQLYKDWTNATGPFAGARAIVIQVQHENPFFDDSYSVNSENVGPYGDAIVHEFIPYIEAQYRGIGQGWARALYGGSTGGWESIGVQIFYPDEFNGAYAACPDPVAFTSYTTVNIYTSKNAFYYDSSFKKTPRPGVRDKYSGQTVGYGHPYGQTTATIEEMNLRELVLGRKSRSCQQFDIWEAVFGPKAADGYPARIWNKLTGEINHTVAAYWREHFDLRHILERDAATLQDKLAGKINLFVGNSDTYFLTDAVMDMQDYLEGAGAGYRATVTIGTHQGRGFEHCFNGYGIRPGDDRPLPNSVTRNFYNQKFVPQAAKRFVSTAPEGADLSWSTY